MINKLKSLAKGKNITVTEKRKGHFYIKGDLLVNYYPYSEKKTAYVAGTRNAKYGVSPKQAIKMAIKQPRLSRNTNKRNTNKDRQRKAACLKKDPHCHWCRKPLTKVTATIEHKIPLSRGGLDNSNNTTIACLECNNARGNNMTEIRGSK